MLELATVFALTALFCCLRQSHVAKWMTRGQSEKDPHSIFFIEHFVIKGECCHYFSLAYFASDLMVLEIV